ncbi:DedA family protein [Demequina silvatica]|uniref:DedA family protein n=1 Tax=Demequina silvatica TaxID=1638988 RepID=UPI001E595E2C|nr:VTT domain-containing protein [Demequina silvatica]
MPSFISDGPWWWLYLFLCGVVFLRTQATYWIARWARTGADAVADRAEEHHSPRARLARRFSGPGMEKAREFSERWGWFAIPLSFLTFGIQTLVNGAAGYSRMRWDLYTLAMIPGCLLWATVYTLVGLSLWSAWTQSPWLLAGGALGIVALAFGLNWWRRRRRPAQPADASSPYAS